MTEFSPIAAFRLAPADRLRVGRVALLTVILTWLPLLLLAIAQGVAWGDRVDVSFLEDFLPYGQTLLVVPVLIIGEFAVGRRLAWTMEELRRSDVLAPEDTPALERVLARVVELWRGRKVNTVILLISLATIIVSLLGARKLLTGSWHYVDGRTTLAGWWYVLVSVSVIRFLILRWLWRFMLWTWVLWSMNRLRLQPQPTHPDRAGGMAFLGGTQAGFSLIVFVFGAQLSSAVANAVCYRGADLMSFKGQVVAFAVLAVVAVAAPLFAFAPKLLRAREESLMLMTSRGYRGARHLESELRSAAGDELPAADVSALTDFGALYQNARLMWPVPMGMGHVVAVVASAVLPFLPLVFLVMPVKEVVRALAGLLM